MSFLSELKRQKVKLKQTETVVTSVDGQRFLEKGNSRQNIASNTYGFVVDTKPDNVPVLVTDFLYIGSQDCTANDVLQSFNIRNVLSLGVGVEMSNVNHKFVECLDLPETDIKPVLAESLPFLRMAVESKENILVHCNAGVSRTALVAIAYLMQYEGMQFDFAYNIVKGKRAAIQPNAGFKRQLRVLKSGNVI